MFTDWKPGDEIIIGKILFFDGYLGKVIDHPPVEDIKKGMVFCHQGIFSLKNNLEKHCFDLQYRYCADYEWLLAMYVEGKKIRCIDTVIANYDGGYFKPLCTSKQKRNAADTEKIWFHRK